ncbi:MAG: flagellar basal body L-ring protein FlgH [Candidatus Krumholzibacteria bacterium]|jgi:flagellar L-ring protein precursor FlgH|nr:flagellar basal body L-ring protein FlgH [Candidatus Krumholzibacteria bacterium]
MRPAIYALIGLVGIGGGGNAAGQTPLLDMQTGNGLFSNFKAHRVGDVVTILIVEQTTADASTEVDTKSKTEIAGGPGLGFLQPFSSWGLNTENKHQGDGSTSRTGNLQAEISVTIADVLPNGNYLLAGARAVEINGDRQLIEISGICRPRDINPNNTILSTYIADARIAYSGSGLAQDAAAPGILSRIVNWLF